jgi:hypothetical protein
MEDNVIMDLMGVGWGGMNWIDLAHNGYLWRAILNTVINFLVPYNFRKFLSNWATGGFSRRAQLHRVSELIFKSSKSIQYQ